ncbi:MAG TPA: hypothetical protein VK906_02200 [Egicoccus sp.]|nr:hypothetical protein [Egicoccus sp.]HSK21955.1 hypothetical protein [Egicoccus sp.]
MQARDVVFHGARIVLVVAALLATAWPIQRLERAAAVFDRGGVIGNSAALVALMFVAVLLMLLARRRPLSRLLQVAEGVVAVVLIVVPVGLVGFPPVPRWVLIALFGGPVQPLATAWLAIVLTRPANPRDSAPISDQPVDTIVER